MTSVSQIEIFVNGTEVLKVVLAFCLQENLVPTLSFSHPDFTTQGGLQQKRDIHNALQHIFCLACFVPIHGFSLKSSAD
jgi:hypothetical protein